MRKKYFYLLFIVILTVLLTGCGSDNSNVNGDENNYGDSQQSCGALGWYESGKCCKAISTGRYVDEYGECPARSVPGYEVPVGGYAQNGCFTILCN